MKTIRSNELRELIINNPEKRFLVMDESHDMMVTWAINELHYDKPVEPRPFGATVIGLDSFERGVMEGNDATYHYDWTAEDYDEDDEFILFEDDDIKEMTDAMLSVFKTFPVGGDNND